MTKKKPLRTDALIPVKLIERRIYLIRGQKVMLDRDLGELYQVKPIALRQQVKRNSDRFPEDFMFQLTKKRGRPVGITKCDTFEADSRRLSPIRLYPGRRSNALRRAAQQASNTS